MTSSSLPYPRAVSPYADSAAGQLATWLVALGDESPVVVGLAPEAMPLAAAIADALGAPLDTVAVQPLAAGPAPSDRFGVAAEGGIALFDPERREFVDRHPELVDDTILETEASLQSRTASWHHGHRRLSLHGRNVILVCERLIDQRMAAAAVCAVLDRGAAHVVYAARRARLSTVQAVQEWVDETCGLEFVEEDAEPLEDTPAVPDQLFGELLQENRDECCSLRRRHARP